MDFTVHHFHSQLILEEGGEGRGGEEEKEKEKKIRNFAYEAFFESHSLCNFVFLKRTILPTN